MDITKSSLSYLLSGLLCATALPALVDARTSDRDQEVEINAGRLLAEVDGVQEFTNGFTLVQGTLNISAERAYIHRDQDSGDISRIVLHGAPAKWRETLDDGSEMDATANSMDYDLTNEIVVMQKDVVVNKARDQISGNQVRYDLASQKIDAGSDGSGQVTFRIKPKKKN